MSRPNRRFCSIALVLQAALVMPAAHAVHLDPNGLGQVLLYPYYTVNAGRATVVSVVNSTAQAKALKLRFREAVKGKAVLDFNLYLAPYDVYTAALVADGAGTGAPARLLSDDASCTVPAGVISGAVSTRPLRYAGPDDGPPGLERTREGWIELIEMGVVEDTDGSFNVDTSFFAALAPIGGRPTGCDRLIAAWNGGVWSTHPTRAAAGNAVGVSSPRGGLYGGAMIVDVVEGVVFPYSADAIDGFYTLSQTQLHTPPGSSAPDLAAAQTSPGHAVANLHVDGRAVALNFVAGRPDAVSAVLMAESFFNEYSIEPALGAASEWVVTLPTWHLHAEQASAARRRPFLSGDPACEVFRLAFFDRETGPEAPLPDEFPQARFCHQAQVLPWGGEQIVRRGPTPLLASQLIPDFAAANAALLLTANGTHVPAGHAAIELSYDNLPGRFLLDGVENAGQAPRQQLFGLPVTGFGVANYVNVGARPGLLANYSVATRHRSRSTSRAVLVTGEGTAAESITPVPGR